MNDEYVPPAFRHRSDPPPSQPPPEHRPPPAPNPISRIEFERLFGGRVFAWMGGLAILLGVVFFLRSAVDSSWFTEEIRTLMGAVGSFLLLVFGVWLHERRGHLEVAKALVAAAIPGLFATTVVATQTYDLIPPVIGLEAAALIGLIGIFIAVRWSSMLVGSVGMLGALAAPMLTGTSSEAGSIAFVAMALAASVGVLLWQRWNWLSLGAFAVSAPQLVDWVWTNKTEESTLLILAVLVGFWLLYAAAAFGYELRKREEEKLPAASWLLLLASSTLILGLGGYVLDRVDDQVGLNVWIFGFAGAHLLLGEIARRFGVHREVGSLLTGGGIGLASFGVAHAFDGPTVVAAWSALAAALAFVATRADATPNPALSNAERLSVLSLVFLGLGIAHVLFVEAPPVAIAQGVDDLGSSLVAIACCGAASVACWYFGREVEPKTATVVGFIGSASFVYLGSVAIIDAIGVSDAGNAGEVGQAWMSAFWAATGLGAIVWGMVRREPNVRLGGLALLAVTIVKVWTYDLSELEDIARAISFIGLGLLLLAGAFAYQRFSPSKEEEAEEAFEEEFA
ncbi:MAG TPA: DUF2339 domain-containing protein [Solirubrobacterales bacterium]|nr:DUF2339 domain-containing protein [Solirubrobacterales bacterium]